MKNVYEVLRQKELEIARLGKEVEALRLAAPLLSDDGEAGTDIPENGGGAVRQDTVKRWP
jgi:hypothetical protein